MKYKHNFYIQHLPLVLAGSMILLIGLGFEAVSITQWLQDVGTGNTFILACFGAIVVWFGAAVLVKGIEYTRELNVYPEKDQLSLVVNVHTKGWQRKNSMSDVEMIKWLNKVHPSIEKRRQTIIDTKFEIDKIDNDIARLKELPRRII